MKCKTNEVMYELPFVPTGLDSCDALDSVVCFMTMLE